MKLGEIVKKSLSLLTGLIAKTYWVILLLFEFAPPAFAREVSLSAGTVTISKELRGLVGAWGFGFLPDGSVIVTEKRGRMYIGQPGERTMRVSGLPGIHVEGQGGLLDVLPARDFETSREIFMTFSGRLSEGTGTSVAVAELDLASMTLKNLRVIFRMSPGAIGGHHFGSRIAEAADGTLYVTIGDRGDRDAAQDLDRHNGSIIRINRDGSIPSDNPFLDSKAPEIWSYGHRNAQGLGISSDGVIWSVEHGAKGGDELNRIERGANYGWPVISFGTHYTGASIGEGTSKQGMEQPVQYWDPSIAPSGLMIYEGEMFPEWRGDIFVGSLKFDYIARMSGRSKHEREQIQTPETLRVRDLREAPDGSIWFISEDRKAIYKISR